MEDDKRTQVYRYTGTQVHRYVCTNVHRKEVAQGFKYVQCHEQTQHNKDVNGR